MGDLGTPELKVILFIIIPLIVVGWKLPEICEKVEKMIRNRKNSPEREKSKQ